MIEITEEAFSGDNNIFLEAVNLFKEQGCIIAIDDVGSKFSNFDRIAMVQPKIIKVDLGLIKYSRKHEGCRAIIQSFSILAKQMGASLLIEGVETTDAS